MDSCAATIGIAIKVFTRWTGLRSVLVPTAMREATMSRCAGTLVLCTNVLWKACAIASADVTEARRTAVYETAGTAELGGANRKPKSQQRQRRQTCRLDSYANVRSS